MTAILSKKLSDQTLVETVLTGSSTYLCVYEHDSCTLEKKLRHEAQTFVPYSASNNLVQHKVLLLPGEPIAYKTKHDLVEEIRAYIHRYVDLSPDFEDIATHYVLLSWIYDSFNELPYLRFRGDYGSGKTRALLTIGSICYKPIFAGGASTVSPLFRMIDAIRGTLLIDEADFRFSDEKADIVKILNNGNAKGFPILRSEVNLKGEYSPRAFAVFGPKLVASRKVFDDQALESRCITEELGVRQLRGDIPISCPESLEEEASILRSKLLMYRFQTLVSPLDKSQADMSALASFEPRLQQVFSPLYSVMGTDASRQALIAFLEKRQRKLGMDRSAGVDAHILEILSEMISSEGEYSVGIRELSESFSMRFEQDYGNSITPRWIGHIVRNVLALETHKSNGRYFIPRSQGPKLKWLFEKYGITPPSADAESN